MFFPLRTKSAPLFWKTSPKINSFVSFVNSLPFSIFLLFFLILCFFFLFIRRSLTARKFNCRGRISTIKSLLYVVTPLPLPPLLSLSSLSSLPLSVVLHRSLSGKETLCTVPWLRWDENHSQWCLRIRCSCTLRLSTLIHHLLRSLSLLTLFPLLPILR